VSAALRLAVVLALVLGLALPAAAAAKPGRGFYGVVPQDPMTASDYSSLADSGAGTVRIPLNWASVQQVKGKCRGDIQVGICSWTVTDDILANLAVAGIRGLPILYGSPSFVSKNPAKPPLGKGESRWKAFLKAAAERYGRNGHFWRAFDDYGNKAVPITDWQVWNEPNSKQFWHPDPNPRRYAELVKTSAKALRNGDRKADVVLGGMFADAKEPIVPFMRGFYRSKGIGKRFDELAIHPYASSISGLKRQLKLARKAARGNTKIRVTELGWSSKSGSHPLMKGRKGQAKMLEKAVRLLVKRRKKWNITGFNWFALRDTANRDTCSFCRQSGLLARNGNAKPAWRSFKKLAD
jgi:polysaccharide biosynthesis protein PslG